MNQKKNRICEHHHQDQQKKKGDILPAMPGNSKCDKSASDDNRHYNFDYRIQRTKTQKRLER